MLRKQPTIIVKYSGSSQVVLDASPEASRVTSGMTLQEALSRCKNHALLQADESYYQDSFDQIIERLAQKSPLVEKSDLGCAYIEIEGLDTIYVSEAKLITSLLQTVPRGFDPRLGLSKGKFPAYASAMVSGTGQATKTDGNIANFLKNLPIDILPIPQDKKKRMQQFGLNILDQIASMPMNQIQAQFGPDGKRAWELANGIDHRQLITHQPERMVSESLVFPSPATSLYTIISAVEILLSRIFAKSILKGKQVRKANIESCILSQPPWTKSFVFKNPVSSNKQALPVFKNSLETVSFPGALEDIKLTLSGIIGDSGIQTSLFSDIRRQEQLRGTIRQLRERLRENPPIYQIKEVEPWSRIPERRGVLVSYDP